MEVKKVSKKSFEFWKKIRDDQEYIHRKIREGKMDEIRFERPDIKFAKPI